MLPPIFNDPSRLADQIRGQFEEKIQETLAQAQEDLAEAQSAVGERVATDGQRLGSQLGQGLSDLGSRAMDLVGSDEAWGEDIGVDDGRRPDLFDYGEVKETLAEGKLEGFGLEARLRAFGHASMDTISASIGVETENGLTTSDESSSTSTPAGPIDIAGTFRANVSADKLLRAVLEDDTDLEVHNHDDPNAEEITTTDQGETFGGLRARLFGEVGILGGSVGAEGFLGLSSYHRRQVGEVGSEKHWRHEEEQLDIGLRGAAIADGDILGFEALGHVEAGIRGRIYNAQHLDLWGASGAKIEHELFGFAGAEADAFAEAGPTGVGAGAGAFAGAKAGWRPEAAFTWGGTEYIGAFTNLEARLGVGAEASVDVGYDTDEGSLSFDGDVGAALGLGFSVGGGATIYGKDIGKTFGFDPDLED